MKLSTISQRFDRFSDAIWFSLAKDTKTLIGGCGGIGSWLSLFLSRIGCVPLIFDFDSVEQHNIGGQLFKTSHSEKAKVDAISEVIQEFTGDSNFHIFNEKIDSESMTHKYCFSAFDNMKARRVLFESWQKQYGKESNAIFIDGRLMAESYEIFCIQGNDINAQNKYEQEYLFSDDEVEDAPCSLKQTTHMAAMISSQMTAFFTNFLTNIVEEEEVREVPFFHSYFLPMNLITTHYDSTD